MRRLSNGMRHAAHVISVAFVILLPLLLAAAVAILLPLLDAVVAILPP
jgi:hypothetical protein